MLKFEDGHVVEVEADIEASREAVWELVSDINLSARFQDEFQQAEWLDDEVEVGSRFIGRNARGETKWEATSYVSAYEPLKTFGWSVSDPDNPGATWTFHLEPSEAGTHLRYSRLLGPGPSGLTWAIERHPEREHEIIEARNRTHHENMTAVVAGVKALAESGDGAG